jgi:Ran GTPase-activating protein (RanGAP) involved in mRNA processing and transport
MESNLIGNTGLNAISKALMDNISLREIYLYNNELTCDGVLEFADCLKNKKSLTTLGVEYNHIRSRGICALLEPCKKLHKLERVFLNQNKLDS